MAGLSQDTRPLRVQLGSVDPDGYVLTRFAGTEAVSQLYRFTLDLAAPVDAPLPFEEVLGKLVVVSIDQAAGKTRFVHGIVNRFSRGKRDQLFAFYRAELVPLVWLLTKQVRSRTFQQKTVKEILQEVFSPVISPRFTLDADYFPRNFCVQYRESDFAFASRLMEEEGIYYYFTHTPDDHELVISDTPRGHDPLPDPAVAEDATLLFQDESLAAAPEGRVSRWDKAQELRAGSVALTDHIFELPTNDLQTQAVGIDTARAGTVDHPLMLGGMGSLGTQDYPGGYARFRDGIAPGGAVRGGDVQHVFEDNDRFSKIRAEEELAGVLRIAAVSTFCRVTPGHKFTLVEHVDADGDYVVTSVEHTATCGLPDSGGEDLKYGNEFACIPFQVQFRPVRATPRPFIRGTQTAVVVGEAGAEIEPDKYGRVKVQFHWDRAGKFDLDSSCWVRVSTLWAGKNWGMVHIPRIGQEVVVAFLEGDPDQPIIVGSVYNADHMPPYALPANKTQSGIKSHSSPGGDSENFNEIMFEDKKGQELVSIHAEKDLAVTVENNHSLSVGSKGDPTKNGTATTTIFGDTKVTITKGNLTTDVQAGTAAKHVMGNATENYDAKQTITVKGDQMTHVTGGNHLVKVDTGHASLHVDAGNRYVNVGAGFYDLIAATKISLTVGSSSLVMLADGTITLKGVNIVIDGSASVTAKGGGADTGWKGSKITENGPAGVVVTGATIKLNS